MIICEDYIFNSRYGLFYEFNEEFFYPQVCVPKILTLPTTNVV